MPALLYAAVGAGADTATAGAEVLRWACVWFFPAFDELGNLITIHWLRRILQNA